MKDVLKIMAGTHRGRKLPLVNGYGMRPTLGRVRETLFNWLMWDLPGGRWLDLFAGSGALGLEALSRGANHVDFVEKDPRIASALKRNLQQLKESHKASVYTDVAQHWLQSSLRRDCVPPHAYDVIFLDPPFDLQADYAQWVRDLQTVGCVMPGTKVYTEARRTQKMALGDSWHCVKHKAIGQVQFALWQQ